MPAFRKTYDRLLADVESALSDAFPQTPEIIGGKVVEAARYSLMGGGKRIRPVLTLAVSEMLDVETSSAMPYALALEMIHTYSLIHDDLPCMDDDDLRRGRPTCHRVYGEALAVLAGDALLNRAFEIMLDASGKPAEIDACRRVAKAAGSSGMIGGQVLDLAAEGRSISELELITIHRLKTGALLKAPVEVAVALAGIQGELSDNLYGYADAIGLAFQIQDDILDVSSSSAKLGKTVGKDAKSEKSTYVTLLGLDEAVKRLDETIDLARDRLALIEKAGKRTLFLSGLAEYLRTRTK